MKILFVAHDIGIGGGEISLQQLVRNFEAEAKYIAVPRHLYKKLNVERLAQFYSVPKASILPFYLPYDLCSTSLVLKSRTRNFLRKLRCSLVNLLWRIFRAKFYKFLDEKKIDIIHLNSSVLNFCINERYSFYIHIREIVDKLTEQGYKNISKSRGVIFIDESTKNKFPKPHDLNNIIINNPFDMTDLKNFQYPPPISLNFAKEDCIIISMIGNIIEDKGVKEVIEAFRKCSRPDLRLLIIGHPSDGKYKKSCEKIANEDERIIFTGQFDNIKWAYQLSDYIIRGENEFRIGRTIFEGLYAGCNVIIPATSKDINECKYYEKFKLSVYNYCFRDVQSLLNVFNQLPLEKKMKNEYLSNIEEYLNIFIGFISKN